MRKILYTLITVVVFCVSSCQESLEDRAEREAREYTKQFCPTPITNYTRTDSVVFYKLTKSYTYYCSFSEDFDNEKIVDKNKKAIHEGIYKMLNENPELKGYKEAGFKFVYIVHSAKEPTKILYQDSFSFTK